MTSYDSLKSSRPQDFHRASDRHMLGRSDPVIDVEVSEIFGWIFRQGDLVIIEDDPATFLEDMTDVMTTLGRCPHVTHKGSKAILCKTRENTMQVSRRNSSVHVSISRFLMSAERLVRENRKQQRLTYRTRREKLEKCQILKCHHLFQSPISHNKTIIVFPSASPEIELHANHHLQSDPTYRW